MDDSKDTFDLKDSTLIASRRVDQDARPFKYNSEVRRDRFKNGRKWSDILIILAAGFALISDGYQNNVMTMLNQVFTFEFGKEYTSQRKTNISNASLVTTIFGQVGFGIAADYIGRKKVILIATGVIVLGSAMAAAAHGVTTLGLIWMLIVSRGVIGLGVGAEYSACSTSSSEACNNSVKRRGGMFVMSTNLPLSFGGPAALIIFLIVNQICGNGKHLDPLWRIMFALGCVWPLSIIYFRLKLPTSELYKRSAIKSNVPYVLAARYYWKRLIGTTVAWFLYDFVTFPNGVFSAGIISNVLKGSDAKDLNKIACWTLLLGVIAIPGVFIGAVLMDIIGRKYTIMIGFTGCIIFGLAVGLAYDKVTKNTPLFIVLFGLMMSSGNLGPGNGMGLISSECYATPIRGTCYGISAAIGKVGAVVGTQVFSPIQNNPNLGKKWTFIIAAICGVAGVLVTFIFVPHLREDDLLEEDIKFKNYLVSKGWKGTFGSGEALTTEEAKFDETSNSDLETDTVYV